MESFIPEGYVDVIEGARILGIHPETLSRLIRQQRIPGVVLALGKKYLIKKTDLQQFASRYDPSSVRSRKPWYWIENALKEALPEGIEF